MGRLVRSTAVTAVLSAAAMLCAPATRCDNNTFLDYLATHGYTGRYRDGFPVDPGRSILFGIMACNNLRDGYTLEEQMPRYWVLPEFPLVVEAAQHELCPDTLG